MVHDVTVMHEHVFYSQNIVVIVLYRQAHLSYVVFNFPPLFHPLFSVNRPEFPCAFQKRFGKNIKGNLVSRNHFQTYPIKITLIRQEFVQRTSAFYSAFQFFSQIGNSLCGIGNKMSGTETVLKETLVNITKSGIWIFRQLHSDSPFHPIPVHVLRKAYKTTCKTREQTTNTFFHVNIPICYGNRSSFRI